MTDERPRPQYGEYAPEGWVSPNQPPPPVVAPTPLAAPVAARPRRTWDVILTGGLLALGLYTVVSGFVVYGDLAGLIDQVFQQQGIGDFTSTAAAATASTAINVVQAVLFLIVAVLAIVSLRAGRIAFIWPLIGGIVSTIIVATIVVIVMVGDPAFIAYSDQLGQ